MKKTQKNQQGRSMVEMLAVLAIMGVLSVTGIYAYNLAMIKHQANELVHKLNLAYVEVMSYDSIENWENLKTTGIDNIALKGHTYNDVGFVKVSNVKKDICENIITNNPGVDILTPASTPFTKCESLNDMVFDFDKTGLIGIKCESNDDCLTAENQYCSTNSGVCINKTDCTYPTPVWSKAYDKCVTCQMADKTAPLWVDDTKECVACDSTIPYYNGTICTTCPDETPYWDSANAKCDTCLNATPTTPIWSATAKDCVNCATADVTTPVWNLETKLCEACPAETPNWSGTECVACPADSSMDGTGNVTSNQLCKCIASKPWWDAGTCKACVTNYKWNGSTCVANCPANSATNGTGNITSNPLCKCIASKPWWNANTCKVCNSGYKWNGTTCIVVPTTQSKCAAAGWAYSGGYCTGAWFYGRYGGYTNSCSGRCESVGLTLSSCERSSWNVAPDTYEFRPICR